MGIWKGMGYLAVLLLAVGGAQGSLSSLEQMLEEVPGTFSLDSRIRYEVFDLEGGLDVDGVSHRIRYGYLTPESGGVRAMVEGETLYAWGHGRDLHPADNAGDGTELNQLWVAYRDADLGGGKLGRQIYTLDDHRFVGHVGWRQNIQTFDALTLELTPLERLVLRGFAIDAVNNVSGRRLDIESYGLNGSYELTDSHTLTGFYYVLNGRDDLARGSNDTAGLRFTGKAGRNGIEWKYAFSYARQWENADFHGRDFGHDYFAADVSAGFDNFVIGAGVEILEGDGRHGFTTPLATLHKFNGYADVFLAATAGGGLVNGLEDAYLYAAATVPVGKGIRVQVTGHSFLPHTGGGDYGTEIDLVAGYAFTDRLSGTAKFGDYQSEGGSGVVGGSDKQMLTIELNFIY